MSHLRHAEHLKAHGVRPTPQRLAVYEYLLSHRTHPSADAIYEALLKDGHAFSRTTIYNSLKTLLEAGLIRIVAIDPAEQRFDGNPADHGHCRCTTCGTLFDFDMPDDLSCLAPQDFCVSTQDVFFTGLCANCSSSV